MEIHYQMIPLYGCLVFIYTVGINSKPFPWPVHFAPEIYPQSFFCIGRDITACCNVIMMTV